MGRLRQRAGWAFLGLLVILGGLDAGRRLAEGILRLYDGVHEGPAAAMPLPLSRLPGPPRDEPLEFVLKPGAAAAMQGVDDPGNERWSDLAGNHYASAFCAGFSYARPVANGGPQVLVRLHSPGPTLAGRLEARGLKPNFAYQLKLRGDRRRDAHAFEAIGRSGRWRLPGRETNYSDADYEACPDKDAVEAYLLFDFFVTDATGAAVREFAADSSLHVLWNAARQRASGVPESHRLEVVVHASDPAVYARPKRTATIEYLWAEHEHRRYGNARERITLPPGSYQASLVLTEESFHSTERDGGWWATVMSLPVDFTITRGMP